eukprot:2928546-Prorocentrum_lima.AAC.1
MTSSLVGSEMCIRDSVKGTESLLRRPAPTSGTESPSTTPPTNTSAGPVSYTHLTLPTICSV